MKPEHHFQEISINPLPLSFGIEHYSKTYKLSYQRTLIHLNKDENVHRFALSAIRGEPLEIEREREKERGKREKEKGKRNERERKERERKRKERERKRKERERNRKERERKERERKERERKER